MGKVKVGERRDIFIKKLSSVCDLVLYCGMRRQGTSSKLSPPYVPIPSDQNEWNIAYLQYFHVIHGNGMGLEGKFKSLLSPPD